MLYLRSLVFIFALVGASVTQTFAVERNFQDGKEHIFSSGEILHISVLHEEELTRQYKIDDTGMILMPLIGKVHVEGLNAPEIELFLTAYLKDGYLLNPIVSVTAIDKRGIYVLGAVKNPGHYDMPEDQLTILKAVAIAGGFTRRANKKNFELVRHKDGQEERTQNNSAATPLSSGDLIIVKERFF